MVEDERYGKHGLLFYKERKFNFGFKDVEKTPVEDIYRKTRREEDGGKYRSKSRRMT